MGHKRVKTITEKMLRGRMDSMSELVGVKLGGLMPSRLIGSHLQESRFIRLIQKVREIRLVVLQTSSIHMFPI